MFLTERQRAILDYIDLYRTEHRGVSPTQREICEHFGFRSFGTIQKHLRLLEEKGALKRAWNQKRGLTTPRARRTAAPPPGTTPAPAPRIAVPAAVASTRELPFAGVIAAGLPLEAIEQSETIAVPAMLAGPGEHYVLQVRGDSMIEDGVCDGDLVVVARRETARNGEVVVAEVNGEATLKRIYLEGARVRLQPANSSMQPIYCDAREVRVRGVLAGLIRKF